MTAQRDREAGFTLIEAMVALAILGIASVGIIRAVEAHIDRLGRIDARVSAQLVAENALAEARLGIAPSGVASQVMLQKAWLVSTALEQSEDPDLWLATVRVAAPADRAPIVTLRGFVDKGTTTAP